MKRKNHHNKAYPAWKMLPKVFRLSLAEEREYIEPPRKETPTHRKVIKKLHNKRQRAYFKKLSRECLDELDSS